MYVNFDSTNELSHNLDSAPVETQGWVMAHDGLGVGKIKNKKTINSLISPTTINKDQQPAAGTQETTTKQKIKHQHLKITASLKVRALEIV